MLPISRGPAGDPHRNPEIRHEPPAITALTEKQHQLWIHGREWIPRSRCHLWPAEGSDGQADRVEGSRTEQSPTEAGQAEPSQAESEPVNREEPEASVAQTPSWREAAKALPLLVPTARPPVSRDLLTLNSPLAGQQGSPGRRRLAVPVTAPRRRGTQGQRPGQIACRGRSERPRSRDGTDPRVLIGQRARRLPRSGSAPVVLDDG